MATPALKVKVGATWKVPTQAWVNVAGTWKAAATWVNVAGTWKNVSLMPPPTGTYAGANFRMRTNPIAFSTDNTGFQVGQGLVNPTLSKCPTTTFSGGSLIGLAHDVSTAKTSLIYSNIPGGADPSPGAFTTLTVKNVAGATVLTLLRSAATLTGTTTRTWAWASASTPFANDTIYTVEFS